MTRKKKIAIVVILQLLLILYGAFAVYQYYMNSVFIGKILTASPVNGEEGFFYYPHRDDMPGLGTRNGEYQPYLRHAQTQLAERFHYYSFFYGNDLELNIDVKHTGLFRAEITYSGSGKSKSGETRQISDTFDFHYLGIYWGREATLELVEQERGEGK